MAKIYRKQYTKGKGISLFLIPETRTYLKKNFKLYKQCLLKKTAEKTANKLISKGTDVLIITEKYTPGAIVYKRYIKHKIRR